MAARHKQSHTTQSTAELWHCGDITWYCKIINPQRLAEGLLIICGIMISVESTNNLISKLINENRNLRCSRFLNEKKLNLDRDTFG